MMNTLMYDLFNEIFKTGNWGVTTWEDLNSESEFDKDDADEDAKVVVGLVATITSEAEPK